MELTITEKRPLSMRLPMRYLAGVLVTLALALSFFYLLMRPSMLDLQAMALFLAITAGISLAAGYLAYRFGLIHRSPSLRWTLLGSWALAGALTFLNVWLTARLMFASQHDLRLATVLLLFAGGIAMSLGYFLAAALTDSIAQLTAGAQAVARGQLDVRVPVAGRNEMAELAASFNEMAAQLQATDQERRDLEAMRRNLVAWAGHDLRTPLASVQAIIEALADGMVDDADTQQRYLRTARRDVQVLAALIDDLFDLAQFDAGRLLLDRHPTPIADLVSNTIERYAELAARHQVALAGDAGPDLIADLDAQKIERVLTNLVGNALRHTPAGGRVQVRAAAAAGQVEIEVIDTGEGIGAEDLPHVFDQFYRGEKSRSRTTGGAGLGLAIARRIVEAHGGRIWAESRAGEGARFVVRLPAVQAA